MRMEAHEISIADTSAVGGGFWNSQVQLPDAPSDRA